MLKHFLQKLWWPLLFTVFYCFYYLKLLPSVFNDSNNFSILKMWIGKINNVLIKQDQCLFEPHRRLIGRLSYS